MGFYITIIHQKRRERHRKWCSGRFVRQRQWRNYVYTWTRLLTNSANDSSKSLCQENIRLLVCLTSADCLEGHGTVIRRNTTQASKLKGRAKMKMENETMISRVNISKKQKKRITYTQRKHEAATTEMSNNFILHLNVNYRVIFVMLMI